ncbi:MupG family TIM beta-alpha barrel fold protein [Mesoplasma florum]|uniref:MupG family TIM beta-alpha barrel fold protein n=1 Tax=Mesoplasma florum TaxID=2151 RepID=UPI000BE3D2EA|nr:MupG family TIM beta-alpha barrel fold protein [Mesoplasma florum]ATI72962.1 PTS-associated protein [Mesoplasma florum]AVN61365.1 PTS-associated protein [Mesoplasma florum]
MKREIGISIYPEQSSFEKDKEYLDLAKSLGYKVVFTSLLHFVNDSDQESKQKKVLKSIKYAYDAGFYTILDVEEKSLEKLNKSIFFSDFSDIGVSCIRMDTPLKAMEFAFATHNPNEFDLQINMSNNDSLIDNIIEYKPVVEKLSGCHNFFPFKYTGLPFDFFEEANKKFLKHNIYTSAFVGSSFGTMTPAINQKELPTLEMQRELPIDAQAKILFYSDQIKCVIIGNSYASNEELEKLAAVSRYTKEINITLDEGVTKEELEIINSNMHYRRADINEYFVRSCAPRIFNKKSILNKRGEHKFFKRGDVIIVNNLDERYKAELHIVLKDEFENYRGRYNRVGSINLNEIKLLDFLTQNTYFKLKL